MKTQLLLVILICASSTFIQAEGTVSGERLIYFKLRGDDLPRHENIWYGAPETFVKFAGATTSVISDTSPEWPEVWHYTYRPGAGQVLRFEVFKKDELQRSSYDVIGTVDVNLDELVRNENEYIAELQSYAKLIITITNPIAFKLKANNLPNADNWFDGQSDPWVSVADGTDARTSKDVGYSDVILNTANPIWPNVFRYLEYVPGTGQKLYFYLHDKD